MDKHYTSMFISGPPVAGKSTLAKRLGEYYGLEVFSIGKFFRQEWKKRYPKGEVSFEEYWAKTTVEENKKGDKEAREIVKRGGVICEGRFGLAYEGLPVCFIFLTADIDTRAKRALKTEHYRSKSLEEIKDILTKREVEELAKGKALYGRQYDWRDPSNYHLVLNSGKLSVGEEAAIITSICKL